MAENLLNSAHKATNEPYREGYERTFGKKPVVHEQCGGVAFFNSSKTHQPIPFHALDFTRVDGTSPKPGEVVSEKCAGCGEKIGIEGQVLIVGGERYIFTEEHHFVLIGVGNSGA